MRHTTAVVGEPPEARGVPQFGSHRWLSPLVHATASLGAYVTVDSGSERRTTIGAHTMLMKHVHIGHDALIGANVEIAPGAVVCGFAIVADGVKIGVNASILPYVAIGDGATIGAGAVVTKHVPPGETWVGNPAARIMPRADVAELQGVEVTYRCGCTPSTVSDDCPHHGAHS